MGRALAAHDALCRSAVHASGGRIVKTTGDGMYAVFDDPADAVGAAIALQVALTPEATGGLPITVRCGIHFGRAERRDDDFFGASVNCAARIMGAAHGGQVLLSEAAGERAQRRLPSAITLLDLGRVRLKDLGSPQRLLQVRHASLREQFPPLRSLEAIPNNLPQQLTSFLGRAQELDETTKLLRRSRLLTLHGMGGLGKTRLSLQIAADALEDFPDGAWFVDFAPLTEPSLAATVMAQALGIEERLGQPILRALEEHVRSRKLLVILDNCEHLVDACAELAHRLLAVAPELRVIATSREPLRLPGEQSYPLFPMRAPAGGSIEALQECDAAQLFLDRARLANPRFELRATDAPVLAQLTAQLEGIPLAIELAAARTRSLTLAQINDGLQDRFKLLSGGARVHLPRQQTLRALVGWSYDLLSESERITWDRLSVFVGGWDLVGATAVCGVYPVTAEEVSDLVMSLADRSLISVETGDTGTRFRMLETLRAYGDEKLRARGEKTAALQRHCDFYRRLAKDFVDGMASGVHTNWVARLEFDVDNFRAIVSRALTRQLDPIEAVKLAVSLQNFWILAGYVSEGLGNMRSVIAMPEVQASERAHAFALYVAAALAATQGDPDEAAAMLESCLAIRRRMGSAVDIAATLSTLSFAKISAGAYDQARADATEALAIFRTLQDRVGECICLLHLSNIALHVGDGQGAHETVTRALAIAREHGHAEVQAECARLLGELRVRDGDLVLARQHFDASLDISRATGDKRNEAIAQWWIGRVHLELGEWAAAAAEIQAALSAFMSLDMHTELIECIDDCAAVAQSTGAFATAAELYAASMEARARRRLVRARHSESAWESRLARLRTTMGEKTFDASWTVGTSMTIDRAARVALESIGASR